MIASFEDRATPRLVSHGDVVRRGMVSLERVVSFRGFPRVE
jgi:hypothetical protein